MDALDNIMAELDDIVADLDAISIEHTSEDQLYHEDEALSNTLEESENDNISILNDSLNISFEIRSEGDFSDRTAESFDALEDCDEETSTKPFNIESIEFIDECDENDELGCDSEVVDRALESIDRSDLDKAHPTQIIQCQDLHIDLSRARVEPELLLPETLPGVTRILLESRLILRQASAKLNLAIKIILVQAARQLRISYRRIVMEQRALVGEEGWTEELAATTGDRLMDVTDRTVRMAVEFIKNASRDVVETAVETLKESLGGMNDGGGEEGQGELPEIEYKRI